MHAFKFVVALAAVNSALASPTAALPANVQQCPTPWPSSGQLTPPPDANDVAQLLRRELPNEVIYFIGDSTIRHQWQGLCLAAARAAMLRDCTCPDAAKRIEAKGKGGDVHCPCILAHSTSSFAMQSYETAPQPPLRESWDARPPRTPLKTMAVRTCHAVWPHGGASDSAAGRPRELVATWINQLSWRNTDIVQTEMDTFASRGSDAQRSPLSDAARRPTMIYVGGGTWD